MNAGETLRGQGASSGLYRGYAHVCHSGAEVDDVPAGCILVVETAGVAGTRVFDRIGALISEHGGILSNVLTIAREDGIPTVVGIDGATALIHSGDELVVDGARGLVETVSDGVAVDFERCVGVRSATHRV